MTALVDAPVALAPLGPLVWGVATALGAGLLIGLERERRKGQGRDRQAAGIRSFTLAALGGALAQLLAQPALVALGALAVVLLAAVSYYKSRVVDDSHDPGLTTELALVVTYIVGVLAVAQPTLGAAAAVVVAALLAARERLHRFATLALSDAELRDALLLAALALILLPLLPAEPLAWAGGMRPRTLGLLLVLILALQGVGHVALRLFGPRAGLALSGLFSGFVSSTATIASMGARARAEPAQQAMCEAGAMWSTAATWLQAMLMLLALSPPLAWALALPALAGALLALGAGAWRAGLGRRGTRVTPPVPPPAEARGPLRLREAALVALLLSAVALGVAAAQQRFGDAGLLVSTALAAFADAHAPVAALGALHAEAKIDAASALAGVLVAIGTNSLTRTATAFAAGGRAYGLRIGASLAASTGAAAALWWWLT